MVLSLNAPYVPAKTRQVLPGLGDVDKLRIDVFTEPRCEAVEKGLRGEISPPPVYTFFTEISFSRELRYCARYMAKIKFRQQRGAGDRGIWLGYSSERKPQFYLLNYCPFERTPSFCALLLLILIPLTWSTSLRHVCLATSAPLHA